MVSKMDREHRAKQFVPFAALKGYEEALRRKEKEVVSRIDLSEEYQEELDGKLRQVGRGDIITVIYFKKSEYLKITGMVSKIDKTARIVQVVNTRISLDDIYDLVISDDSDAILH